ncbi:MAG: PQQ-binding-like beta-propeller repeat protein, partial [Lentisphaeria bacterium]
MKNDIMRKILRFLQWVTITFILVLSGLIAHDGKQNNKTLSMANEKLDELKLRDLEDEKLAKVVRDLDFLYRRSYFQSVDKQRYGFMLLGVAFFIICGLMLFDMLVITPSLKIPSSSKPLPDAERKQLLIFSSTILTLMCAGIVFLRSKIDNSTIISEPSKQLSTSIVEPINLQAALESEVSNWPQFLGSLLPNKNILPSKWDFQQKWQASIPLSGFNSPVIWQDKIFVSGGDKQQRAIFCYDVKTGEQLWQTSTQFVSRFPTLTDDTGVAAPTLCVDKNYVYAIFATGEVLCCGHDGKQIWLKNMPHPEILYGYASSPLLLGDKLILQYDMEDKQTLYALNIHNGEILWQTPRESSPSWSTPRAVFSENKTMIFTAGNNFAEMFDLETGKLIWKKECMGGEVATTAFIKNNLIYFSNSGAFTGAIDALSGEILFRNDNVP